MSLDPSELEAMDEEESVEEHVLGPQRRKENGSGLTRHGTANSARDAREVEDSIMPEEEHFADVSIGAHLDIDMVIDEDDRLRGRDRTHGNGEGSPKKQVTGGMKPISAMKNREERRKRPDSETPASPSRERRSRRGQPSVPDDERPGQPSTPAKRKSRDGRQEPTGDENVQSPKRITRAGERRRREVVIVEMQYSDRDSTSNTPSKRQHNPGAKQTKAGASAKTEQAAMDSETEPEDDEVEKQPESHARPSTKTHSSVTVAQPGEPSSPSKFTGSPLRPHRVPRPQVSVELPSVTSVYSSPAQHKSTHDRPSSPKFAVRTDSIHVAAPEAATLSASKRGRPSASPSKRPRPASASPPPSFSPPPKPVRRKKPEVVIDTPSAGARNTTEVSAALTRTPSKRSAATRATQKLRDEIMPDVVNFQKEMKRGTVRAVRESEQSWRSDREETRETSTTDTNVKGKKRVSLASTAQEESLISDDGEPEKKRRRTSLHKVMAGDISQEELAKKKGKARDDAASRRRAADSVPADIRYADTQCCQALTLTFYSVTILQAESCRGMSE